MIISFNASFTVDKIAAAATGPLWYQLYPRETTEDNQDAVEQAQAGGCRAVVITVDCPVGELHERTLHGRNLNYTTPGARPRRPVTNNYNLKYGALTRQRPWIDWKLLESFRKSIKVPILGKGILTAEDAKECVAHGWDGIIVSNHGGRSNDYTPSTLEVLTEIVDAVQGRVPVLIDSGFRRGSDVLKALALGAKAVCLGRSPRYGLAAYGPAGAKRVLEIVQNELSLRDGGDGMRHARIDRSQPGEDGISMKTNVTRRFALWAAASPLVAQTGAPKLEGEPKGRITPREEVANVFEVESVAERKLGASLYAAIAGGDRQPFDRILLRPRRFVNVERLDLTCDLFGQKMFTPILIGPAERQQDFHPEGELAMVRGASLAQAVVVISARSSQPIEKIAAESKTPLWYQVEPEADMAPVLAGVQRAVKAGCKVVCVTVGSPYRAAGGNSVASAAAVDQIRRAVSVPVVLKGVMRVDEAKAAIDKGIQGVIVSNNGGLTTQGLASPIEVLASVVDAVAGKASVLVDGSFRRGTDIVKALAFGAKAVLVTRPALWGLAAYGSDGVDTVMKILQSETARTMGNCSKVNLAALDRTLLKLVRF
jgi:isopentenyl diphosphate isomerase/L-lactate dehydrogenase-like FMN-dependent dehydrogenase